VAIRPAERVGAATVATRPGEPAGAAPAAAGAARPPAAVPRHSAAAAAARPAIRASATPAAPRASRAAVAVATAAIRASATRAVRGLRLAARCAARLAPSASRIRPATRFVASAARNRRTAAARCLAARYWATETGAGFAHRARRPPALTPACASLLPNAAENAPRESMTRESSRALTSARRTTAAATLDAEAPSPPARSRTSTARSTRRATRSAASCVGRMRRAATPASLAATRAATSTRCAAGSAEAKGQQEAKAVDVPVPVCVGGLQLSWSRGRTRVPPNSPGLRTASSRSLALRARRPLAREIPWRCASDPRAVREACTGTGTHTALRASQPIKTSMQLYYRDLPSSLIASRTCRARSSASWPSFRRRARPACPILLRASSWRV